jgi:cell pole-organizing protein PopZ
MSQAAKAQEPSMEEILASIRRIIADDDASKPAAKAPEPAPPKAVAVAASRPPPPPPPPPSPPVANDQHEVDAVLAEVETPRPEPVRPAVVPPPADVLDLTEAMAAPAPDFHTIDGSDDVVFTDRAPEPAPPAQALERAPLPPPLYASAPDSALLSNTAAAAVDSAFNTLANTVLGQNARTLEDLVKEMLRPMLKSWLDDNLPGMVERIVRAEIERVSRGKP